MTSGVGLPDLEDRPAGGRLDKAGFRLDNTYLDPPSAHVACLGAPFTQFTGPLRPPRRAAAVRPCRTRSHGEQGAGPVGG